MVRSRLVLVLLLVGLYLSEAEYGYAGGARRKRWSPEDLPNPQKDFRQCMRGVRSSICDPEGILTNEQQNMVDGLINEIASGAAPFKTAECGGGGQQGYQVGLQLRLHAHAYACGSAVLQVPAFGWTPRLARLLSGCLEQAVEHSASFDLPLVASCMHALIKTGTVPC